MIVNKLTLLFILYSIFSFSQSEKTDVYFLLNTSSKEYVIGAKGTKIINVKDKYNINSFKLYDKSQYREREKKIAQEKKENKYFAINYSEYPTKTLFFKVLSKETEIINHCDTHFIDIINYKWLLDNSWTENNPNILFKNLYFLLKIEKDKYLKYEVVRTVIAQ